MAIDCAKLIDDAVSSLRMEFDCQREGRGVSVVTPYLRSDSGLIEVFVEEQDGRIRVSDLGETFRCLKLRGADPLASAKGRFMAEQTAARLHVSLQRARIEKLVDAADVANALLDVAAAAHALDGLIYTSRAMEPATFSHEVQSFLDESGMEYAPKAPVMGRSGKTYRVGFHLAREGRAMLLQPLSPSQPTGATALVNRTVRMWVDLDDAAMKISLLDDRDHQWRAEDDAILARFSTVTRWSTKEDLLKVA